MRLSLVPPPPPHEPRLYDDLPPVDAHFQGRARREGYEFDAVALEHLVDAGCRVVDHRHRRAGYQLDGAIATRNGFGFIVLAHGNIGESSTQPGLQRTDTIAKVVQRAVMLHARQEPPLVVVTSHLPRPGSAAARQLADLHALLGYWVVDVVATTGDLSGFRRLEWLFTTLPRPTTALPAPWRTPDPGDELLPEEPRSLQ